MTAALAAVVVAVFLIPELFGLAGSSPFLALVTLRPLVAAGLLLAAGLTVAVRRRSWAPALAVALVAIVALGLVAVGRATPDVPSGGRVLTVLSFNVDEGTADPSALAGTIREARPDVVVLPEAGDTYRGRLLPLLGGLGYRGWTTGQPGDADVDGVVVLAAPGLRDVTAAVLPDGAEFRWVQLSGGGLGATRIVALHAAAPLPDLRTRWVSDTRSLQPWCLPGAGPAVLAGDFNATLDQALFRSATSGCTDAASATGRSLVATWPTSMPRWLGVQIDHVLGAGGVRPTALDVIDLPGSDHRALLAHVALPGE